MDGDTNPELLARCHRASLTLGEFAQRVQAFVAELVPLHPAFADLRLVGKRESDSPPLLRDLSNLEPWIFDRSWYDNLAPVSRYTNLGPEGRPTASSQGLMGFKVGLSNLKGWDGKVDVDLRLGSPDSPNTCNIVLPRKAHPEFRQSQLPQQLLELVVRHWPVRYASFSILGWHNAINWVGDKAARQGNFEIGWLTYVNDPSIAAALPPDVRAKPLGSGILFQLAEHFTSHERAEDVALGLRVKQALESAGKLRIAAK